MYIYIKSLNRYRYRTYRPHVYIFFNIIKNKFSLKNSAAAELLYTESKRRPCNNYELTKTTGRLLSEAGGAPGGEGGCQPLIVFMDVSVLFLCVLVLHGDVAEEVGHGFLVVDPPEN